MNFEVFDKSDLLAFQEESKGKLGTDRGLCRV